MLLDISEEKLLSNSESHTMNPDDLQIIIQNANTGALAAQATMFDEFQTLSVRRDHAK